MFAFAVPSSRGGKTGLPGARRMELHGLARPDSLWLLHRILERDGLSLDDPRFTKEKLDPLLCDLADHPLSLELVGPHLRTLTPEEIRADFGKLLDKFQQTADEGRNRSLLASLEFSRRHLSPAARAAGSKTGNAIAVTSWPRRRSSRPMPRKGATSPALPHAASSTVGTLARAAAATWM